MNAPRKKGTPRVAASKCRPLFTQQRTSPDRPNRSIPAKPGGLLFDHLVGAGAFVPAAFGMWQGRRDSLTSVNKNMVEAIDGKPSGK